MSVITSFQCIAIQRACDRDLNIAFLIARQRAAPMSVRGTQFLSTGIAVARRFATFTGTDLQDFEVSV